MLHHCFKRFVDSLSFLRCRIIPWFMLWDFSLLLSMNNNQLLKLRELSIGYSPKETPLPQIRNSSDAHRLLKELFEPNSLGLNEQFVVLYMNRAKYPPEQLHVFICRSSLAAIDLAA